MHIFEKKSPFDPHQGDLLECRSECQGQSINEDGGN